MHKLKNILVIIVTICSINLSVCTQALDWNSCLEDYEEGFECALIEVPLDYTAYLSLSDKSDYRGSWIRLPLLRLPATDPKNRKGSILFNPGGPGASGIDLILDAGPTLYSDEVRARFDYIGFDPRGTNRSAPLICTRGNPTDINRGLNPAVPFNADLFAPGFQKVKETVAECEKNAGAIIHHMSTADVAHDLEQIRIALKEEHLNFVGFSYGSFLGVTYANLYPNNVGRMIIDGVIEPQGFVGTRGNAQSFPLAMRIKSYEGTHTSLLEFFSECDKAGKEACPIAGNSKGVYEEVFNFIKGASAALVEQNPSARIPYNSFVAETLGTMYSKTGWTRFATRLFNFKDIVIDGNTPGAPMRLKSTNKRELTVARFDDVKDAILGLSPSVLTTYPLLPKLIDSVDIRTDGIEPDDVKANYIVDVFDFVLDVYPNIFDSFPALRTMYDNALEAIGFEPSIETIDDNAENPAGFYGVTCSDTDNPTTESIWKRAVEEAEYKSPYGLAKVWSWQDLPCLYWPNTKKTRYTGPFNANTANGILILNTRHDAATPYFGALEVRNHHPNSRLVTVDGAGHVTLGLSKCADTIASNYLVTSELLNEDSFCPQDLPAFTSNPTPKNAQDDFAKRREVRTKLMNIVLNK